MSTFTARLRLPGQSRIPLGVEVDVSEEAVTLTNGDRRLAIWDLRKIDVDYLADGFHIKVDDEEVVLSVSEPARFASELGVTAHRPAPRPKAPQPTNKPDDDIRLRMSRAGEMLADDAVSPQAAFAEWLSILKELDTRHARGAMPSALFHELNGALLAMFPAPDVVAIA